MAAVSEFMILRLLQLYGWRVPHAETTAGSLLLEASCCETAGNSHHCLVDGNIFSNSGDGVLCLPGARHNQISSNVYDNPGLVNRWVPM